MQVRKLECVNEAKDREIFNTSRAARAHALAAKQVELLLRSMALKAT
jgi:hypothetical protein